MHLYNLVQIRCERMNKIGNSICVRHLFTVVRSDFLKPVKACFTLYERNVFLPIL